MDLLQPFKHLVTTSRKVTIGREDSDTGSRIGGNAPDGILPPVITTATRYFLTLGLGGSPAPELSLFVSIDWEDDTCSQVSNSNNLWNNVSKLQTTESPLIQCVIHPQSLRSHSPDLKSDLIGRSLIIETEASDIVVEPQGELLLGCKIGGRPYYYYGTLSYIESLDRLFEQGFCLLLQYTEGGYEHGCPFLSPFGEYTFHLLAKETEGGIIWRYGWG